MKEGLIWLPLLATFIGLAWAGWNEYQKIEAYKRWAVGFEQTKYDIYSVLGRTDRTLVWGKPTRHGPIDVQTLNLNEIQSIELYANSKPLDLNTPTDLVETGPPVKGKITLEFVLSDRTVRIPFTELRLALQWARWLQKSLLTISQRS